MSKHARAALAIATAMLALPAPASATPTVQWRSCGGWMSLHASTGDSTHFKVSTLKRFKKRCPAYRSIAKRVAYDPTNIPHRIDGFKLQGSDESPLIYKRGAERIIVVIQAD